MPDFKCHSCAASLEQLMLWVFPSKGDCLLIIEFTLLFSRASRVSFKVFRMHFPRLVCLHHFYQSPYPNANQLELLRLFSTQTPPLLMTNSGARYPVCMPVKSYLILLCCPTWDGKPCTEQPQISLENLSLFRTGWTPNRRSLQIHTLF